MTNRYLLPRDPFLPRVLHQHHVLLDYVCNLGGDHTVYTKKKQAQFESDQVRVFFSLSFWKHSSIVIKLSLGPKPILSGSYIKGNFHTSFLYKYLCFGVTYNLPQDKYKVWRGQKKSLLMCSLSQSGEDRNNFSFIIKGAREALADVEAHTDKGSQEHDFIQWFPYQFTYVMVDVPYGGTVGQFSMCRCSDCFYL